MSVWDSQFQLFGSAGFMDAAWGSGWNRYRADHKVHVWLRMAEGTGTCDGRQYREDGESGGSDLRRVRDRDGESGWLCGEGRGGMTHGP